MTVTLVDNQVTEATMKADLLVVYQKMRSELIEEMKKNQEEMLQKLESKIDDIHKDNKKSLEELTSTLSISYENPEKSDSSVKRFKLKHIFYNVNAFRKNIKYFSEWENHFNVKWRLMTARFGDHLGFYIFCEPIAPADKWSIRTKNEYKVVGRNQEFVIRSSENCHRGNRGWGFPRFQEWGDMREWFLVNGNLKVEVEISIIEIVGLEKKRIRKFDESQKDVSDVILVVGDTKFYVSRTRRNSRMSVIDEWNRVNRTKKREAIEMEYQLARGEFYEIPAEESHPGEPSTKRNSQLEKEDISDNPATNDSKDDVMDENEAFESSGDDANEQYKSKLGVEDTDN